MNTLASYQWLKEYFATDCSPEDLARELSLKSMSVERIDRLGEQLTHIVVGVIQEVLPHPNADKLHLAVVDIGTSVTTIVCGGLNLVVGMKVCVALPGATVFSGKGERMPISISTIRGVESPGMLCGPAELGFEALQTTARFIWDIGTLTDAKPGTPVAEALGLDDVIFDVEITTNRPDAMGRVGLAREAAVAVGGVFNWKPATLSVTQKQESFKVSIEDKRCSRQMAAVVKNVKVGPAPWWIQKRLLTAGVRPINVIVDITNYVMLESGQPLHAFDAAKIDGEEIRVRAGKKGEKILALNGKEYDVKGVLVLADAVKPLDIAGIMGGEETGTKTSTTDIVFVASAFDAVALRRASRALDLQSDAQLLFEKGLSPNALPMALARAVELAEQIAGGTCVQTIDVYPKPRKQKTFTFKTKRVRERIGVDISDEQQIDILTKLGFGVTKKGSGYAVTVPYWREDDIENEVDFTEEVARMYGYHNMPAVLPASRLPEGIDDESLMWEGWTKRFLASLGFTEFFSNSLVSMNDLECFGVSPKDALAVMNPLTADLTHLRPKLVPSVLRAIERNQAMVPAANVFELGRVYIPREGDLPEEQLTLVIASYGMSDAEATFMHLRGVLEALAARTGLSFTFERRHESEHWHTGRTMNVIHDGCEVAILGQVASNFQDAYGIHRPVFMARINLESLIPFMKKTHRYQPVPVFPAVVRDIAVLLDERTEFAKVHDIVCGSAPLITRCSVVEIYRGEGIADGKKSITISVTMMSPDRTLTSQEVDVMMTTVAQELALRVDGTVRS